MACRSLNKANVAREDILKEVPNASVEVMTLNLGDLKSVRAFAEAFNAKYDHLDILMNNAGIMTPPYGKTVDGFETQFGTNHLGHFALTGLVLPKLLETPKSRIVTVSSGAYAMGRINFDDLQSAHNYRRFAAYGQSKLANILFSQELHRRLQAMYAETISVASQPGYAVTNLQANQQMPPLEAVFFSLLKATVAQSATVGATYQLYAATAPDVHGGEFYEPKLSLRGRVVRSDLNAQGRNIEDAKRLWDISEQLTGVHFDALKEPALVKV